MNKIVAVGVVLAAVLAMIGCTMRKGAHLKVLEGV